MDVLLDSLIGNKGLDSDVAKVIYELFKGKYRYVGNAKWEYKTDGCEWKEDSRAERLWIDIMAFSNNALIHRAIFWDNQNNDLKKQSIDHPEVKIQMDENTYKSITLLQIARKFKHASYKKTLLQELKAYFVE